MTNEKFKNEIFSLNQFFTIYCENKHLGQKKGLKNIKYKNIKYTLKTNLCEECEKLLNYSFNKLQECPHEIKPRCRRCSSPCYEKEKWKKIAKLMKYSGLKLGFLKIKKHLFKNS